MDVPLMSADLGYEHGQHLRRGVQQLSHCALGCWCGVAFNGRSEADHKGCSEAGTGSEDNDVHVAVVAAGCGAEQSLLAGGGL